jgi:hypothetical protein
MAPDATLNTTRLPRAVLRKSTKLDEQYGKKDRRQDPADPTGAAPQATEAPPTENAAPPVTTAPPVDLAPTAPVLPTIQDLLRQIGDLEQKNRSITGRLAAIAEERRTEKALHRQEMTKLQEQVRDLKAVQPQAPVDLTKHFTADEIETLGEAKCQAMIATAQKVAQDSAQEALKPIREQQVADAQAKEDDAQERYIAKLLELVPDCLVIDKDQAWLEWLAETDDDTGEQRQVTLDRHNGRRDAPRVARMFKAYQATLQPVTPPAPPPTPPVAPRGKGAQPTGDVPSNRQPNTGATGRPSPKEIADFYKRAATKRIGQPGYVTDQERAEFERRLGQ